MNISLNPELLHIYGPLSINAYGLCIALGIAISMYLVRRNKRYKQLHLESVFSDIITVSIIAGIIGGRAVEIISNYAAYHHWIDWFALWEGGFSALGAIIGVITITPWYIKKLHIPLLPTFDLVAIYAPLMQSIARIGCLLAGCCHGIPTTSPFAIIYTHPHTIAHSSLAVHPTQLYSSLLLLCIFLYMFFYAQHHYKKPGLLFCNYLILTSLERFLIDFLRADHADIYGIFLSFHQIIALLLLIGALIKTICIWKKQG